jgi:hypothetical protein
MALVLVAVAVLAGIWSGRVALRAWREATGPVLPAVSAPPPLPSVEQAWIEDPPRSRERFALARERASAIDPSAVPRLVEWLEPVGRASFYRFGAPIFESDTEAAGGGPFRIEYSLDETLTDSVFEILRRGRVSRGIVLVIDPRSGRLLTYAVTDPEALPPGHAYPAASIVKIVTAAALIETAPDQPNPTCVYRGNKYRLSRRRIDRPRSGHRTSLRRALAHSNNRCFSQWAAHDVGREKLLETLARFGWLTSPAPGHDAGQVEPVTTQLELGRLGSGLDGLRVNPLHVAMLASVLTDGRAIEPWWVDRIVDAHGRSLQGLARRPPRRVITRELADRLRRMLVSTTQSGTAKSAFRDRRGRPLLPGIDVAGKTGNLTADDPYGRYEWFLGVAPAESPTIGVVVLQVQSNLWWMRSSELGAKVLREIFCERNRCTQRLAHRWTGDLDEWTAPLLISELDDGARETAARPASDASMSASATRSNEASTNPL